MNIYTLVIFFFQISLAFSMTSQQCDQKGGLIVNTLSQQSCLKGKSIGEIEGTNCPCICCVGENKVDCSKNEIKLLQPCDAGDELKFSLVNPGSSIPVEIIFSLDGKNWSGGATAVIDLKKKIHIAKYSKNDSHKDYEKIILYTVRYKDIPLMDCLFPLNKISIPIQKCKR